MNLRKDQVIVDPEDRHWLENNTYYVDKRGYVEVARPIKGHLKRKVYLHRLITGAKSGELVDHIDGNRSNNAKSNLRICTRVGNGRNNRPKIGSKRLKGAYRLGTGSWVSKVRMYNRIVYLGTFSTEMQAAYTYDLFVKARDPLWSSNEMLVREGYIDRPDYLKYLERYEK